MRLCVETAQGGRMPVTLRLTQHSRALRAVVSVVWPTLPPLHRGCSQDSLSFSVSVTEGNMLTDVI